MREEGKRGGREGKRESEHASAAETKDFKPTGTQN